MAAKNCGIGVAFSNAPQAEDHDFRVDETVGDEVAFLNVMENDSGGNDKSLCSVDDGSSSGGPAGDLLVRDQTGAFSANERGAKIWITRDARIAYDASRFELSTLA